MPWPRKIRWSLLPLSLAGPWLGACGDDGTVAPLGGSSSTGDEASTGTPTSSSTAAVDEGTSTDATGVTSTDGSTADTGFDPPVPACGNGFVEADEECDDANAVDDDACSNACQVPCGLQWSTLALGPTLDSEIEGLFVARDGGDAIVVAGRLREITVEMDGTMTSDCFGGQLILDTLTPVAVAAGQLCPNSGEIAVNGGANGTATITYEDGGVTVTPEGGQAESYPSCLAPELLMCPA